MDVIAEWSGLDAGSGWILLGVAVCLLAGTLARGLGLWRRPGAEARQRWSSLRTWWVLYALLVVVLAIGRPAVVPALAVASLLALRESLALTTARRHLPLFALLAGGLYLWAWIAPGMLFTRVLPALAVAAALLQIGWWLRAGPGPNEARAVGLAVLVAVVGPSFAVAVASLPAPLTLPDARLGWLLLLLVLTELDDIAQAWWGRALGRHRMTPVLSPNKTWEGLAGGIVTTVVAALLLAPLVTDYGRAVPLDGAAPGPLWAWSAALGLVVALAGTAGDLTASYLKRRAGVKDSGSLLPGQGGVLDRIDSLSLAAPAYFALTWALWTSPR